MHNISRSKINLRKKFSQFIQYSRRKVFLEKSYTKCGTEASPCPFKISNQSISLDKQSEILYSLFFQVEDYQDMWKLRSWTLILIFFFFKKKYGTSLLASFSTWFWKKNISHIILTREISSSKCLYFLRYWTLCVLLLFASKLLSSQILKFTLDFLSSFSAGPKKPGQKKFNISRKKSAFNVK